MLEIYNLFVNSVGAKYSLKFFERYAKDHGFDPLVAENWYIQSRWHILSTKVKYNII